MIITPVPPLTTHTHHQTYPSMILNDCLPVCLPTYLPIFILTTYLLPPTSYLLPPTSYLLPLSLPPSCLPSPPKL